MKNARPIAPDAERHSGSVFSSDGLREEATGGRPTPVLRPLHAMAEESLAGDEEAVGKGRGPELSRGVTSGIEQNIAGNRAAEEASESCGVVAHGNEKNDDALTVRPCEVEKRGQLAAAGRAPRCPEVHEDDMATQRLERCHGAAQAHETHVRGPLRPSEEGGTEGVRSCLQTSVSAVREDEKSLKNQGSSNHETTALRDPADVFAGGARHDDEGVVARPPRRRNRGPGAVARVALALLAFALFTVSCSRKSSEQTPAPTTAPAQAFKGGPAAHPGDWCGGHGVPESECTRCNPELIPQFQTRHDWCGEHGVPESQCALCHPELLRQGVAPPRPREGRPAGETSPTHGAREAPASDAETSAVRPGTTVRFARPAVAERVGIQTVEAEARPLADEVMAPVRLDFDPARLARVSARVPGVVRTFPTALGATVRTGDLLVTLDSAVAATTRADLVAASTRLANAEVALRRVREVRAAGVGSQADIEAAETAVATARAGLTSLRAASTLMGAGDGRSVQVLAPRAGVVVRQAASVGQQVTAEEILIEIADLSTMWAILDVSDAEAPRLAVGQSVTITMEGIAQPFQAPLAWLAPTVDAHTRTVQARVELPNLNGRLRANAFGRARVAVGSPQAGIVVPRDALQRVGEEEVVFVARSPLAYEARVVAVVLRTSREAQLSSGVAAGERVVTTGSFELKTELLRDSIGAGCCDDEG